MNHLRIASLSFLVLLTADLSQAEEFDGVEFPAGAISFADSVVAYEPGFGNGEVPTHEDFLDPDKSLQTPDYPRGQDSQPGSVSLGSGGRLTLTFVDNVLTGSGDDRPDLHIFEVGTDVEDTFVEISKNGRDWISVGKVSGAISSIDIDAYGYSPSDHFRFVRLTDDAKEGMTTGETVGADIDAVGAISTVAKQAHSTLWMLIVAIILLLIVIVIFRSKHWREKECLRFLWVSTFLSIALLVIWFLAIQLQWTWVIFLVVISMVLILCSLKLIASVKAHGLARMIFLCAYVGGFLGLLVILLSFFALG